jgi:hypothetical protein
MEGKQAAEQPSTYYMPVSIGCVSSAHVLHWCLTQHFCAKTLDRVCDWQHVCDVDFYLLVLLHCTSRLYHGHGALQLKAS